MKKINLLLLIVALPSAPLWAADSYTIDSRHTFPEFEVNHLGFSMQRGRFNQTSGTLTMDPEAGTGRLKVEVNAASIDTGLDDAYSHPS